MNFFQKLARNPALVLGVVVSGLSLLVLFGVNISQDQMGGIGVFLGAVIALTRYLTTPASEVVAQLPPGKTQPIAGPASLIPDGTPVHVLRDI